MKLLFLHRFKDVEGVEREFGGAERQLVDLACGLQSRGHQVTLVTFYPGGGMLADAYSDFLHAMVLNRTMWREGPLDDRMVDDVVTMRSLLGDECVSVVLGT